MTDSPPVRRLYHGSCHCGHTRYICYLTLPPPDPTSPAELASPTIKKCNCTACHKANFFHVRLADAPNDFVLLSPTDPFTQLSDYQCGQRFVHGFFCGTCGIRCFAFGPSEEFGEKVEIDLEAWLGKKSEGKTTQVWRPKKEGYEEEKTAVLRITASSLDAGQDGLDLREWHEKGLIAYVNGLEAKRDEMPENRFGKPFPGGMY